MSKKATMRKELVVLSLLLIFILFFRISFIQADAKEINGTLNKATKNYIIVDRVKYAVTKKTVISDIERYFLLCLNTVLYPHLWGGQ